MTTLFTTLVIATCKGLIANKAAAAL
jgi:hypothetical protein